LTSLVLTNMTVPSEVRILQWADDVMMHQR